jgi:hypothetical protein
MTCCDAFVFLNPLKILDGKCFSSLCCSIQIAPDHPQLALLNFLLATAYSQHMGNVLGGFCTREGGCNFKPRVVEFTVSNK